MLEFVISVHLKLNLWGDISF